MGPDPSARRPGQGTRSRKRSLRSCWPPGRAGCGHQTEIAKVLAHTLGRQLIRLQCYEGLDLAGAAYEWNYPRQMLAIRLAEATGDARGVGDSLWTEDYLVERPLLSALRTQSGVAPVLLIDELDRADEPFEAFLLEILSDYQLSIPELGTVKASVPPIVIITSNRTREIHDALRRRCLYHWVDYPSLEAEREIVKTKVPRISAQFRDQLLAFVHALRNEDLFKLPGVAETIDWAEALTQLDATSLTLDLIDGTLGSLLKYQDDISRIQGNEARRLLAEIQSAA
jgi:MoxR-like ATPase